MEEKKSTKRNFIGFAIFYNLSRLLEVYFSIKLLYFKGRILLKKYAKIQTRSYKY